MHFRLERWLNPAHWIFKNKNGQICINLEKVEKKKTFNNSGGYANLNSSWH